MTRSEREQLIERYLSGEMSSAEEGEFFIQVALDSELRLDLKAHRTIDSAISKERETVPAEHTALRGRMASMLAATPGLVQMGSDRGTRTAPDRPQLQRTRLIDRIRTRMTPLQWFLATATAAALTLGSVMMPTSDIETQLPPLEQDRNGSADADPDRRPFTIRQSNPSLVRDTADETNAGVSTGGSSDPLLNRVPFSAIPSERQLPALPRKRPASSRAESKATDVGSMKREGENRSRRTIDTPAKQEANAKEKIEVRIRINPNGGSR